MSETPTHNEKDDFMKRAANVVKHPAFIAGATVATVGLLAGGQALENANRDAVREASEQAEIAASAEYTDSIRSAIEAQYDAKDRIGQTITLEQGDSLIGPALFNINSVLGDELFEDSKPLFYDTLQLSIQLHNEVSGVPQPGDRYNVVETDINPEANDGNEYIVVKENQIVHTDVTELPSPETH